MKQIVCEMCGSKDLIKKDGVYTCEYCGAKYTAEEAKKLMIEGTVDVSGSTVKVDTSDELSNLYQLARRARANDDDATASKYYDMILLKAPNSWEAIFYSLYYKATQAKIDEVQTAIGPINNYGANIFGAIKIEITDKEEQKRAYMDVAIRMVLLSAMAFSSAEKYFNIDRNRSGFGNIQRWINEAFTARQLSFIAGISLDNLFGEDKDAAELAVKALKQAIEQTQHMVGYLSDESKKAQRKIVKEYTEKIQKYEPSYSPPSESSGCYVATAVYGSYDCPEVWTLRRFRDSTLAKTWYGRAFIYTYYAVSPALVRWFGHTEWFKKLWRGKLDRMVAQLKANGVADTPYDDICW